MWTLKTSLDHWRSLNTRAWLDETAGKLCCRDGQGCVGELALSRQPPPSGGVRVPRAPSSLSLGPVLCSPAAPKAISFHLSCWLSSKGEVKKMRRKSRRRGEVGRETVSRHVKLITVKVQPRFWMSSLQNKQACVYERKARLYAETTCIYMW